MRSVDIDGRVRAVLLDEGPVGVGSKVRLERSEDGVWVYEALAKLGLDTALDREGWILWITEGENVRPMYIRMALGSKLVEEFGGST